MVSGVAGQADSVGPAGEAVVGAGLAEGGGRVKEVGRDAGRTDREGRAERALAGAAHADSDVVVEVAGEGQAPGGGGIEGPEGRGVAGEADNGARAGEAVVGARCAACRGRIAGRAGVSVAESMKLDSIDNSIADEIDIGSGVRESIFRCNDEVRWMIKAEVKSLDAMQTVSCCFRPIFSSIDSKVSDKVVRVVKTHSR